MLAFNTAGLLVPATIITSTHDEFKEQSVIDSPDNVRRILYNQYAKYKDDLKNICGGLKLKQWIDSSFVTKKQRPFDIDLVTFVDFELAQTKEKQLKEFIYPASMVNYGVDAYIVVIYPAYHKLHFAYQADLSYWVSQFDKTKPTKRYKRVPKGFLEIIV